MRAAKLSIVSGRIRLKLLNQLERQNPFPAAWRLHSFYVDALPVLNESGKMEAPLSATPAHQHLIEKVRNTDGKTLLLFTGPLTDLARALDEAPDIEEKIDKLVWMGGTFERGNVEEPEHDGTAEWNVFWDPEAAYRVWQSGIQIDLVALESTNKVPLTPAVRNRWAAERRFEGVDFLGNCYAGCPPLVYSETNSTYYLWDVLTTASVGREDIVKKNRELHRHSRWPEPRPHGGASGRTSGATGL